jgi:diguanylate cyclase (GGDEF)-like protein/PAS domain S-box-containing protein
MAYGTGRGPRAGMAMPAKRRKRPRRRPAAVSETIGAVVRAREAAAAAVAEAERAHVRLRDAIDILPQGIVFLDAEGRYILWNQRYADIYQRSADLFDTGARLEDALRIGVARGDYPAAMGREEEWFAERLAQLRNPTGPHEQLLSDGRCILVEDKRTSDGGMIGLRVDITELKRREASFRLLFDENPVPMFVHAVDGRRILAVNDAAVLHYGYRRETLVGASLAVIEVPDDGDGAAGARVGDATGLAGRHCKADGSLIDVALFARRLAYDGEDAVLLAAVDMTERKRAEARIAFMALHDSLTQLPNRVMLRQRMEEMLSRARRDGSAMAVLCIDIDDFKAVNDTLGHPAGDRLLKTLGGRVKSLIRDTDIVARLGGDEFAVLAGSMAGPVDASRLAARILEAIAAPCDLDGHTVAVGASIGIAFAPADGEDPDALLKNADMALYRAKGEGKGTFRFFEAEMDARIRYRRALELDLRTALDQGQIEVHYQPLVRLDTEALLRWYHPERGMVPPGEFVPVAEETGMIRDLGAFVLRRACADAVAWPQPLTLAVNLSPLQFRSGNLLVVIEDALERSGLAPERLELEITEALLLEKSAPVLATLHALRTLGIRISMDDFGTGYSSLSYLRSFPFDKIKIDRSFVRDIDANTDSQAIVRAIIGIGASLGITITAEGIETERDRATLAAEGCGEGQGYLFSGALCQADLLRRLDPDTKAVA